ncbi:hypothetical protein [Mycobacterium sp. D16R24]|uniref:hypothetical protein n=1 Tax=Mycobacterium sp. D16R24 TaxID=1855656 RepID=UPI00099267F7|nr:hypothetical protein [Mycobacterium sp. D16R24]
MIELTALKWFTITGRGPVVMIDSAELGARTIQIGDHVVIDGTEYAIWGIESFYKPNVEPGVIPYGLFVRDPNEAPPSSYRPNPALRNASAMEPVARLSC